MWPIIKRLFELNGVKYTGDQCCFFWPGYVKPTGWWSNAKFFEVVERRCPGAPAHVHQAVVGFTTDFNGRPQLPSSLQRRRQVNANNHGP